MEQNPNPTPLLEINELPGGSKWRSGKVREMFDFGDHYLMVATDRISAYDCVMPNGIPWKGETLTQISHFWFQLLKDICPNHLVDQEALWDSTGGKLQELYPGIRRRSLWVKKTQPAPIECVARGYLSGSGWIEYGKTHSVCQVPLPDGLQESSELPEPIFTPATKAESGHDENISFERAAEVIGQEAAETLKSLTLQLYNKAREYARSKGILIADTKFEFGWDGKQWILIDEVLTPDSSRFWPADQYQPGKGQPSFDKQFVRDYLSSLDWDKTPPAPELPSNIVEQTSAKYLEVYQRLTGKPLR